MKNKEQSNIQVIEKRSAMIISQLAKSIQRVVDHTTLKKIIHLTEEEEGID